MPVMNRWILMTVLAPTLGSAVFATAEPAESPDPAVGLALKLVVAMGGREAWANVSFVHVEAVHDDLDIPEPFVNRIWNDFSRPRVRFSAHNDRFSQTRRIDGGVGVRQSAPGSGGTPLTAEEYESDRAWWEANVYRTLHRIARKDPSLQFRAIGTTRLEIVRPNGSVLNWFVMNQKGEPMLFGAGSDARGGVFGPLATSGQVKYPKWGARADGSWRYEIVRFVTSSTVPPDAFPAVASSARGRGSAR